MKGYIVYREKSGQGFVAIDTISNALYSSYIDSSARPESTVERYKIATLDSCGNTSDISNGTIHQTMLLQGALDPTNTYIGWDWQPYLGISDAGRYYRIMRDNNGTGVWDSVKSYSMVGYDLERYCYRLSKCKVCSRFGVAKQQYLQPITTHNGRFSKYPFKH